MIEEWMDIIDYEGMYKISNFGNVYSVLRSGSGGNRTGRILTPKVDKNGNLSVNLQSKGTNRYKKIHRLVATHFIENPLNKPQVNHIDFNRGNNIVTNLEWCTISENHKHTWNNNRGYNPLHKPGLDHPNTVYGITEINKMLHYRNSGMSYPEVSSIFECSISTAHRLITQYRNIL